MNIGNGREFDSATKRSVIAIRTWPSQDTVQCRVARETARPSKPSITRLPSLFDRHSEFRTFQTFPKSQSMTWGTLDGIFSKARRKTESARPASFNTGMITESRWSHRPCWHQCLTPHCPSEESKISRCGLCRSHISGSKTLESRRTVRMAASSCRQTQGLLREKTGRKISALAKSHTCDVRIGTAEPGKLAAVLRASQTNRNHSS